MCVSRPRIRAPHSDPDFDFEWTEIAGDAKMALWQRVQALKEFSGGSTEAVPPE